MKKQQNNDSAVPRRSSSRQQGEPTPKLRDAIGALCTACGLCCNSVLFGSVELRGQEPERTPTLARLALVARGKAWHIRQPCAAWREGRCQIYPDRPRVCREFHCALLSRLAEGDLSEKLARRIVAETVNQAERIERRLQRLGDTDTHLPLSRRCDRWLAPDASQPEERLEELAELMLAVNALTRQLWVHFYSPEGIGLSWDTEGAPPPRDRP